MDNGHRFKADPTPAKEVAAMEKVQPESGTSGRSFLLRNLLFGLFMVLVFTTYFGPLIFPFLPWWPDGWRMTNYYGWVTVAWGLAAYVGPSNSRDGAGCAIVLGFLLILTGACLAGTWWPILGLFLASFRAYRSLNRT